MIKMKKVEGCLKKAISKNQPAKKRRIKNIYERLINKRVGNDEVLVMMVSGKQWGRKKEEKRKEYLGYGDMQRLECVASVAFNLSIFSLKS